MKEILANKRRVWFCLIYTSMLTATDGLAQVIPFATQAKKEFSWERSLLVFILGLGLTYLIFTLLDKTTTANTRKANTSGEIADRVPLSTPAPGFFRQIRRELYLQALLLLVVFTFIYLLYFPVASMNDNVNIYANWRGAIGSHPLIYLLGYMGTIKVVTWLGGSLVAAFVLLAFMQIILMTFALISTNYLLRYLGIKPRFTWVFTIYCAVMPIVSNYAFAVVKDSAFTAFVIMMSVSLLAIYRTRGQILEKYLFMGYFFLSLFGVGTIRNNGTPILLVTLFFVLWWARKYWRRALVVLMLGIFASYLPATLYKQNTTEAISIPIQVASHLLKYNPECLTKQDLAVMNQMLPLNEWEKRYWSVSVDRLKFNPYYNWEYVNENSSTVINTLVKAGLRCPRASLSAYLRHTRLAWAPDSGFMVHGKKRSQSYFWDLYSFPGKTPQNTPVDQELREAGLVHTQIIPGGDYLMWALTGAAGITPLLGVWVWTMILLGFIGTYLRRFDWFALFLPAILILGTLLVAAPTFLPFRYYQFLTVILPLGVLILFQLKPVGASKSLVISDR